MFEDKAEKVVSDSVEETINNIKCKGFTLVAKTVAGAYLLTDNKGIQVVPNKTGIMFSFLEIISNLKSENFRKQWDDLHLIAIHCPIDMIAISDLLPSVIQGSVDLCLKDKDISFFYSSGVPISTEILQFKAFDLHDDLIAQYNTEKESIAQSGDKDATLVEEMFD